MSLAKVICLLRTDIYLKLNSLQTVNLATIFAIALNIFDISLRIHLHVKNDCEDKTVISLFKTTFELPLCGAESKNYELSSNSTVADSIEIPSEKEDNCKSFPTWKMLVLGIIFLESFKLFIGFCRIIKAYKGENKVTPLSNQINETKTGNKIIRNRDHENPLDASEDDVVNTPSEPQNPAEISEDGVLGGFDSIITLESKIVYVQPYQEDTGAVNIAGTSQQTTEADIDQIEDVEDQHETNNTCR